VEKTGTDTSDSIARGTAQAPGRRRLVAWGALVAAAALLLAPIPPGWLGIWQGELLDFGHVPLFAALVLALRAGFGSLRWALAAALAVAGLAEVVQPLVGRTGDWIDLLRGVLGSLAGAAAIRAYQCRRCPARATAYLVLALGLPTWPVFEIAPYVADTIGGRRAFPVLADFSSDREMLRWQCEQATLARGEGGARLELLPGPGDFSHAAMRPAAGDWRGSRRLCCEFRALDPVELVISVRTGAGDSLGTTHAQVGREYAAGAHLVRLDLAALAARARPRPLDLSDVRYVQFFAYKLRQRRAVVLSRIWLEP
jgi:hypothetical protein